jgi:hypothetical protein
MTTGREGIREKPALLYPKNCIEHFGLCRPLIINNLAAAQIGPAHTVKKIKNPFQFGAYCRCIAFSRLGLDFLQYFLISQGVIPRPLGVFNAFGNTPLLSGGAVYFATY